MNELSLSENLKQIEFEINHYKQQAGVSVWEIGRRLKHVKENDLSHGQFGKWVESIGIAKAEASRFIKIAEEIPNLGTYTNLGTKALYLIATLPEEEKQAELKKAEAGDASTVRELRELKRQLKEQEMENQRLKNVLPADYENTKSDNEQLIERVNVLTKENDKLKNRAPEIQEVVKIQEVVPEELTTKLELLEQENQRINSNYESLLAKRSEADEKADKYDQLSQAIESEGKHLNELQAKIGSYKNVMKLLEAASEAVLKVNGLLYADFGNVLVTDNIASQEFDGLLHKYERLLSELKALKASDNVIEAEYF